MNEIWAATMMVSGGLFAGGAMSIALERVPAWRSMGIADFRAGFAETLRRVDRLQPALLSICLVATIGFAITTAGDAARALSSFASVGLFLTLVGSVAWLVPLQRTVKAGSQLPAAAVDTLRIRWSRGHAIRAAAGVALFVVLVAAVTA